MRRLWVIAFLIAPSALAATGQTCAQLFSKLLVNPVTVELEQRRGVALYRVAGEDLPTAYAETVRPLLKHVTDSRRDMPVYFDVTGLAENRRDAFRETVKIANASLDNPLKIHFVSEIDRLFDPAAHREQIEVGIKGTRTYGEHKGQSYGKATLQVDGMRYQVTVFSRIADVVTKFLTRLRGYFNSRSSARESTIDVINRIRTQLVQEYHLDPHELQIELKNQLGKSQMIDLGPHTTPSNDLHRKSHRHAA